VVISPNHIMIALRRSQIPEYLQHSQFYTALSAEDEDISIPSQCFKETADIDTPSDFTQLLNVARFWGLTEIPGSLVAHSFTCELDVMEQAISQFKDELWYLDVLKDIRAKDREDQLSEVIASGFVEIVRYLLGQGVEIEEYSAAEAANAGHLSILEYLHSQGAEWAGETPAAAASAGYMNCLKFAHENGCPWDEMTPMRAAEAGHLDCLQYAHLHGCPWDDDTVNSAARGGHLACLEYAHSNGCSVTSMTTFSSAAQGHLDCLKYAREQGAEWDDDVASAAAACGSLECLQYAYENSCPLRDAIDSAAEAGHLHCMQYCLENGSMLTAATAVKAARMGNFECLQFAIENGSEWTSDVILQSAYGHTECLKYALENGCPAEEGGFALPAALCGGHLDCVKLLHETGYAWPENLFGDEQSVFNPMRPVESEKLAVVFQYALENGWAWNTATVESLAGMGFVDLIMQARASGIALTEQMCVNAATSAQLETLKYLAENGCPLRAAVQTGAFGCMSLECMKVAYEHSCPWPTDLLSHDMYPNDMLLPCVKFAYDHGCPLDPVTCWFAVINSLPDLLAYAHEVGCPWDAALTHLMLVNLAGFGYNAEVMACLVYAVEHDCPISDEDLVAYNCFKIEHGV